MPQYVVERSARILNQRGKSLKDAKVLILGVAYKQDIDDYRESPALKVINGFESALSAVDYYDPYIPKYKDKGVRKESVGAISPEIIKGYDIIVITTCHSNIDYAMVQKSAQVIFDTKNAMKDISPRENIILL